jgi:hypothetical protein
LLSFCPYIYEAILFRKPSSTILKAVAFNDKK